MFYSRTKRVYVNRSGIDRHDFFSRGFYLLIYDPFITPEFKYVESMEDSLNKDDVCILENDEESYYRFCGELPDGSIVIVDGEGRYYHAEAGKEKRYIACLNPETQTENFKAAVSRLTSEAKEQATQKQADKQRTQEKKQKERLATLQNAVPFKSGLKWGLKSGGRIIVPPIYRRIQKPIGYVLCSNGRKPEPVGYHHVGRESRGRSPIYERGNKRQQRDGLPDYHTGKEQRP